MPTASNRRNIVGVKAETVTNVSSTDFPGHWPGEDHSWNIKHFRRTFRVKFFRNTPLLSQFDLIHTDAAIANTLRRIMIAEVPTLAIESVYVSNNTSIIQDEVLAHRLGLIPLRGDKDALKGLSWYLRGEDSDPREPTDEDTVVLHLKKTCERNPDAKKTDTDPDKLYINHNVYASDILFEPAGRQIKAFAHDPVRSANPDILIAKLRPGQEIDLTMHCVKGIGQDHAKFSPVATASYRLLPDIKIKKPIRGKAAERFAACFPKGVIAIRERNDGEKEAVVDNVRNDTVSREVLRHDEFKGIVELGRVRDHFIFSVESTGQFDADEIFLSAVGTLKAKTINLKRDIYKMLRKQALDAKRAREAENPDVDEEGDAMDTQ
ncbi:DNA-directed RNA polymerase [Tuber brumale]|nr:DNA-directed RNA polymerase [Tuber brumale]